MTNGLQSQIYEFEEFRLDAAKRLLLRGDEEIIPLTPKIFDTLLYLVLNNGKVIEKDVLMHEIWTDTIVEENNLNKNISVLRRVLGEKPGEHHFIVTVPGHGYKFVAEVHEKSEKSALAGELNTAEPDIFQAPASFTRDEAQTIYQISKDKSRTTKDKRESRFWFVVVIITAVAGLSFYGFYFWRENTNTSSNAPIKTVAVLPFKPLVEVSRDEALEMGMADTLISRLGNNKEIIVRPLSS